MTRQRQRHRQRLRHTYGRQSINRALYSHRPSVKPIFTNQIIAAFQKLRAILT
jgi:hypothetical protein